MRLAARPRRGPDLPLALLHVGGIIQALNPKSKRSGIYTEERCMIEGHRSPLSQISLSGTGVLPGPAVRANLTTPQLLQHAIRRNEGRLSADGALIVRTGVHTGRSVQDKFVA